MSVELYIDNGRTRYAPGVPDDIELTTERRGVPGKLSFKVLKDAAFNFEEGNAVSLIKDGAKMFYGYVFTKKRDKENIISVTAYDQLRYLTNKDTYIYKNKTASDVIRMVSSDFLLNVGEIDNTSFTIASRVEDNTSLFDVIYNALDLELTNRKQMFVLYDDFGKLTLKSIENMKLGLIIDEATGENFDYTSTIDDQTYNRIKLSFENKETGKRDIYVVQHGENINKWGVLQYFDKLQEGENGQMKADALLKLYNAKSRNLKITNAFGDPRVRAGCLLPVKMDLGDVQLANFMLVEKCRHVFRNSEHFIDINLRGGEIT